MGNHAVGRAMHAGAQGYWLGRGDTSEPTAPEALAALDALGEPWRGADAEFDDYAVFDEPLGRLIAIAYGWTAEDEANDSDGEGWYERAYSKFRKRYDFY